MDDQNGSAREQAFRDRTYENYIKRNRNEEEPSIGWTVKEGVDPVLRPSNKDARHEPGPGVIGIDL